MDSVHLHLLINHLAVIGVFLGSIVLLFAIGSRFRNTFYAAYTLYIISALGAITAYVSGEGAEETVERISGISEAAIETHEEAAFFTLIIFIVLGLMAIGGMLLAHYKLRLKWGFIILLTGLIALGSAARTAWLGGQIRHTEIQAFR